jgi:hypothetical protein
MEIARPEAESNPPAAEELEELVAALLKVDPEGISGKATKKKAARPKD